MTTSTLPLYAPMKYFALLAAVFCASPSFATTATPSVPDTLTPPTVVFDPPVFIDSTEMAVVHTPILNGPVTSCISSPNLPIGLRIHNTTCVISGTPRFETSVSNYSIIASNSAGSSTFTLTLSTPLQKKGGVPEALLLHTNGTEQTRTFEFQAGKGTEKLTLDIIDVWGRTVWTKTVTPTVTGAGTVRWTGKSSTGLAAAAGLYIVRLTVLNGGALTHTDRPVVTLRPN